jgi:hypothetical protein
MKKNKLILISLSILLMSLISCDENSDGSSDELVRYRVTFESTWSAGSHPVQFPANPHFSGLVGAVHNDQAELWSRGKSASAGIELMAETGGKTSLLNEVDQLIQNGSALSNLSGGGLSSSPGTVSLEFTVNKSYPLVSLVSMVAPSPDWFVGVSSLSLLESGEWVEFKEVDLRVYDAGTDNGVTFTSANSNTSPQGTITRLTSDATDSDFVDGRPHVGHFTFERIQ